jgi:MYXO-CTERM domain-containing protein
MRRSFSAPASRMAAVLCGLGSLLAARVAGAHIKLTAPIDWINTNAEGDPQKITPCGVAAGAAASTYSPTNKVNMVTVGDQLTVTWTETVAHDGHFRIALAASRDDLTDPAVTQYTSDGSEAISVATSTAYPVLADNLFVHKASDLNPTGMKNYSYTITIPNMPCTKCTLQVLQFMANHPLDPSFFYHQCADMMIMAAPGGGTAGTSGGSSGAAGRNGGAGTSGAAGGASGIAGTSGAAGGTSGTGGTTGAGGATGGGGATGTGAGGNGTTGAGGSSVSPAADSSGCSCQTGGPPAGVAGLGLLAVALLVRRRAGRAAHRRL